MMRTFKIYSLSNFPCAIECNYGYHAIHCIPRTYGFYNRKFVCFHSLDPFRPPLPPAFGNPLIYSQAIFFIPHIRRLYGIYLPLSDLFHIEKRPQDLSM